MTIFIDKNFCCHTEDSPGLRKIETNVFDGKCKEYIEGYRFIPQGDTIHIHDVDVSGEAFFPYIAYQSLSAEQKVYDDLKKSYKEGVNSI